MTDETRKDALPVVESTAEVIKRTSSVERMLTNARYFVMERGDQLTRLAQEEIGGFSRIDDPDVDEVKKEKVDNAVKEYGQYRLGEDLLNHTALVVELEAGATGRGVLNVTPEDITARLEQKLTRAQLAQQPLGERPEKEAAKRRVDAMEKVFVDMLNIRPALFSDLIGKEQKLVEEYQVGCRRALELARVHSWSPEERHELIDKLLQPR